MLVALGYWIGAASAGSIVPEYDFFGQILRSLSQSMTSPMILWVEVSDLSILSQTWRRVLT